MLLGAIGIHRVWRLVEVFRIQGVPREAKHRRPPRSLVAPGTARATAFLDVNRSSGTPTLPKLPNAAHGSSRTSTSPGTSTAPGSLELLDHVEHLDLNFPV